MLDSIMANTHNQSELVEIIKERDRTPLVGLYHHAEHNIYNKLIIMNNAFCNNINSCQIYKEFPEMATGYGFDVFQYDFTGLGLSHGDFSQTTVSSQIDDLKTVIDHYKKDKIISLIGHSLGGIVATNAYQKEVEAIVLWNSPIGMKNAYNNYAADIKEKGYTIRIRGGKPIKVGKEMWKEFKTITHNKKVFGKIPVLYIHGSEDKSIDGNEFINNYFISKDNGLREIKGGDHEFQNNPEARIEAIKETIIWLMLRHNTHKK